MKIKKLIKKLTNFIFYLVVIIIGISLVLALISKKTGENPKVLEYKFYIVLSESMEPTINKGDLVIVKKQEIREGDIISFKGINTDTKTTHRVIKLLDTRPTSYTTKGDNNVALDPYPVVQEKVEGTVICNIPYVGDLISIVKERWLIVIIVILVAIVIKIKINKRGVKINE